ncbi:MAG: hypothetical protein IJS60_02430 [Abditibacteriota bacterium]|nr:hypothetical protein [Abditibacteriota bacterium]
MRKLIVLLIILCISFPLFAQDINLNQYDKKIINNDNGTYTIEWEASGDVELYTIFLLDILFKNQMPYINKIVYTAQSKENKIQISDKDLVPGQDYFIFVMAQEERMKYICFDMLFQTNPNMKATIPRTDDLIPLEKNKKKEEYKSSDDAAKTVAESEKEYVRSKEYTFDLEYRLTPEMFSETCDKYNKDLAVLSLVASGSAYSTDYKGAEDKYIRKFLTEAGFTDVELHNLNVSMSKEDSDRVMYAIGKRTLNINRKTYNIICVVIRGTVLGEWFSNFNIGEGEFHEGFKIASDDVIKSLDEYVEKYNLKDKDINKIWICGHSRGAGVANLLSNFLQEKDYLNTENIYTYTMASPNVTTQQTGISQAFNFINNGDFVPAIPYWDNWRHYGVDIQTSNLSKDILNNAADSFLNITGFKYVGLSNKDMDKIIKELNRLAPSVEDFYTKKYNVSAKDGGKTTYDVCNIIGSIVVDPKPAKILTIPNDFNRLMGIMLITNIEDSKILNAHSIEYYYSLINAYNESF